MFVGLYIDRPMIKHPNAYENCIAKKVMHSVSEMLHGQDWEKSNFYVQWIKLRFALNYGGEHLGLLLDS